MFWRKNVKLGPPLKHISTWRKTSLGTWRDANDAAIYAQIEIDASPMLEIINASKGSHNVVTMTAIVGKAVAIAIREYPLINSVIRFGRIYPRQEINIFFQVFYQNQYDDLSGVCIKQCDNLSLTEIANQLRSNYLNIRTNKDPDSVTRNFYNALLPGFLSRIFLKMAGFILYTLNIKFLFSQSDYFGSAMITTISTFDLDNAFGPLLPFTRCPMVITIGSVRQKPVVEDDKIVIKPMVNLGVTLDHRLVDAAGAARLLKSFKAYLGNPV